MLASPTLTFKHTEIISKNLRVFWDLFLPLKSKRISLATSKFTSSQKLLAAVVPVRDRQGTRRPQPATRPLLLEGPLRGLPVGPVLLAPALQGLGPRTEAGALSGFAMAPSLRPEMK